MIDAARALPLLRSAAQSWEWRTPDTELPPWVKKAVGRFADWGTLVEAQIALLTQYLAEVRSYLPKGTKLSDTTQRGPRCARRGDRGGTRAGRAGAVRADDHARGS